jgi:hypothetical protein
MTVKDKKSGVTKQLKMVKLRQVPSEALCYAETCELSRYSYSNAYCGAVDFCVCFWLREYQE